MSALIMLSSFAAVGLLNWILLHHHGPAYALHTILTRLLQTLVLISAVGLVLGAVGWIIPGVFALTVLQLLPSKNTPLSN